MTEIEPDMGSVLGGDIVYIKGDKFSPNTEGEDFKCMFTPLSL
jgi:hypothetical protein